MSKTLQPLLLGLTLTITAVFCWVATGTSIYAPFKVRRFQQVMSWLAYSREQKAPVVGQYIYDGTDARWQFMDLDGKERADVSNTDVKSFEPLRPTPASRPGHTDWDNNQRMERVSALAACQGGDECWYMIHAGPGRAYFECYNRLSKRRIGTLGKNGFHEGRLAEGEEFPLTEATKVLQHSHFDQIPAWPDDQPPIVYINSGQTLYRVDLCGHRVDVLYSSPIPIVAITAVTPAAETGSSDKMLMALTAKQLILVDKKGNMPTIIDLPAELRDRALSVLLAPDGKVYASDTEEDVVNLVAFKRDGTIEWQRKVHLESRYEISGDDKLAMVLAAPIPSFWLFGIIRAVFILPYFYSIPTEDGHLFTTDFWIGFPVVVLIAVVLAIFTYRRERRYYASFLSACLWSGLVFLGGPPAYLAFLAHRSWPTKAAVLPPGAEPQPIELTGLEVIA